MHSPCLKTRFCKTVNAKIKVLKNAKIKIPRTIVLVQGMQPAPQALAKRASVGVELVEFQALLVSRFKFRKDASLLFLTQAIAVAANVNGGRVVQQAV